MDWLRTQMRACCTLVQKRSTIEEWDIFVVQVFVSIGPENLLVPTTIMFRNYRSESFVS